jgi:hypothetical protein
MIYDSESEHHRTPQNTRKALKAFIDKALQLIIALAFTVLKSMDIWADLQTS